MKPRSALLRFAMLLVLASAVQAENLRVPVVAVVELGADGGEGKAVELRVSDSVAIAFPTANPFIQGLELQLRIPAAAQAASSMIVWTLYRDLDPDPRADLYDYRAEHILTQPLPSRVSLNIQVPIAERHGLKPSPYYFLVPTVADRSRFPLLFRLEPIGKGLSPDLEKAVFSLRVRPLYTDEGGVQLKLQYPEGAASRPAPSVFVDEVKVEPRDGLLFLRKGLRSIQVSAPGFRDEIRTVTVEPGKILELAIEFQGTKPVLILEAPDLARVELDGVLWDHVARGRVDVEPGEHTLTCRVGDYTVTRKFLAARGRTYRIILALDLSIQENP